ncbi:MAG: four helix bundle protein [Patescibacteria group bacterium]
MEDKKQVKYFTDIIAWQKSHQLVLKIYKITKEFPSEEKFGLVSQTRRAAISVAANIVEGFARKNTRDSLRFYNISNASLEELKYLVLISCDVDLINKDIHSELVEACQEAGRTLQGWIDSQIHS